MHWIDWCITLIPLTVIVGMAIHSRKYIRGIVDFLAAGRAGIVVEHVFLYHHYCDRSYRRRGKDGVILPPLTNEKITIWSSEKRRSMSRALRIEYPGCCYHVVNRENQRLKVFASDSDYALFIEKLEIFSVTFNVEILSYCLMPKQKQIYDGLECCEP